MTAVRYKSILAIITLLIAYSTTQAQSTKIGEIDFDRVLLESQRGRQLYKEFETSATKVIREKGQLATKEQEQFFSYREKLMHENNPNAKSLLEEESYKLKLALKKLEEEGLATNKKLENEMLQQLQTELDPIISTIFTEQNIVMLLMKPTYKSIYMKAPDLEIIDITESTIEAYNNAQK